MGVVAKGEDTRLRRFVALRFLPAMALKSSKLCGSLSFLSLAGLAAGGVVAKVSLPPQGPARAETSERLPVLFHPAAAPQAAGRAVDVQVVVPPGVPVEITGVKVEPSGMGLKSFHYTLKNNAPHGLVAVEITWEVYFGDLPAMRSPQRVDTWLEGPSAWLAPGNTRQLGKGSMASDQMEPVRRLVGLLVYAEFEDGMRLGPESERVFPQLTRSRLAELSLYKKLLELYRSGGAGALRRELAAAKTWKDAAARALAERLQRKLDDKGLEAVVAELRRAPNLKVPK
jgi:hypothetical protein